MTQLELFKATVSHQAHDEFLFNASFSDDRLEAMKQLTGAVDEDHVLDYFGMFRPISVVKHPAPNAQKPDTRKYFKDIEIPDKAYFNDWGVLFMPGSSYHFTYRIGPLRNATTLKEIEEYPFPSPEGRTDDHMASEVAEAHRQGRATVNWVGHIYEWSWQVRGYEEFLMDMMAAPENCEYILDRLMDMAMDSAIAAAKAGVDFLISGDDVANQNAMMFHPDLWRKFIKSRWAKLYDAARSIKPDMQFLHHSDGNIEAIIPELIDIGVTILNPVQPECMDVDKLKREYGKHLVFDGTVGTQTTMPFGTPEEIKAVVRHRKEVVGADGALILNPTHVVEPEVPVENILAFVEACKEGN